ncbi:MAG: M50 family metallopeptidase [Thermoanaerobaculia bacterium]
MLHLGSVGRTSIDIDASFFFLLAVFVVLNYNPQQGVEYALIWIPVLFLSVLVHELAHAAMIAILGFGSSQIILGGMGGVTINQRRARPWQDMLISLAGPASSFALMYLSIWILWNVPVARTDKMLVVLLPYLVNANLFWGVFNLIPLQPLDGGHAVRDFFRIFLSDRNSFVISIWIGMIVGAVAVVMFFRMRWYFVAFYIAWFIYMAWQQWQYFREHGIPGD